VSAAKDPARHLTERQLAEALLPGATQPTCPVPGCTECPKRLAAAQQIARRFTDEVLPRTLPNIQAAAPQPKLVSTGLFPRLLRPWVMGGAVAFAALLLWIKLRPTPAPLPDADGGGADGPYLGVKDADDGVAVYLRRGESVRPLADGAAVHPGDALRFAVDPARGKYALVVSIDGAQQISVYAPFGGDASAVIPTSSGAPGAKVELPGSVELDATLGDERLWIVLSDAPLSVSALRPQLERLAGGGAEAVRAATAAQLIEALAEPRGVHVVTYLLRKTAAP
jgi:hypothetical protein